MNRAQRLLLQKLLLIVSFLVAVVGTAMWLRYKIVDTTAPLWVLGVIGYGWTFVLFLGFNAFGRSYARKRRG